MVDNDVRSLARGRPALLFATLMSGLMSQGFTFTAFVAALPQMARDLGSHGAFIAQMTMALAALGLMLGSLVSGWILERAGTRVALIVSTVIFGLAGGGGLVFREPSLLLASRFAVGLASACMVTTCLWGIGAEYEGSRRARALGVASALANLVSLGGTLLGGALAALGGWPLAFVQFPLFGAAACLLASVSLRQVRPGSRAPSIEGAQLILRLLPFYLLAALLFAVMFMASTQFAFLLQLDGFGSPSTRSLFIGAMTLVAALTAFCYGPLQQRLSATGAFLLGLIAMGLGLATLSFGERLAYAAIGAILMGLYVGIIGPYVYHSVTERTAEAARGRAIGLLNAFCFLGGSLNPPVFQTLARLIGLHKVFLTAALLMALLALATALRARRQSAAAGSMPTA